MTPEHTDVALVGLGAAGGIAAHALTAAGLDVVALEAGPRLDASAATFDEIENVVHARLSEPKARGEVPTWRLSADDVAGPSPWPMLMVNAVGGTTLHYEGLGIRFLPWTFRSRSGAIERYGASAIPADSTLADWPLSYDDLEPFYDAVEYAIGVAGAASHVGRETDPRGNFFEGRRARPYPMPPLRPTGWSALTEQAARRLGWHPFTAPANINSQSFDGRPACTYCGFCMHNVCYCDAKGATHLTVIRDAESTGLLRIQTGARVVRVEVGTDGRASGVTYVAEGDERFLSAKSVLLATFTYENARLLLLSTSRLFPSGLSNNHGQVGKHYIAHVVPRVHAVFPGRRLNLFNGIGSQVTAIDDFNADNFDHTGLGFLSGGMFLTNHELSPIAFASDRLPSSVPRWGGAWKGWIARHAQSVGAAYAQFDALPYESNALDLDPVTTDPFGIPVVRVTHRIGQNEELAANFLFTRLEEWLMEAGASETWRSPPLIEGRHCYGGTRMGHDADTSVVDAYGFSHEVSNLGILGASTFPTAGGHNPTLTVQALSWRTAARLVDDWGSITGSS